MYPFITLPTNYTDTESGNETTNIKLLAYHWYWIWLKIR